MSVCMRVCTLRAHSLTYCGKEIAGSASARESALCKHNHLLPVGGQWQNQHQQEGLHFASTITYFLWEGNGRISISKRVCTLQAQSLTFCGKAMVASASARGICSLQAQSLTPCGKAMAASASARESALCKHNHHYEGKPG